MAIMLQIIRALAFLPYSITKNKSLSLFSSSFIDICRAFLFQFHCSLMSQHWKIWLGIRIQVMKILKELVSQAAEGILDLSGLE